EIASKVDESIMIANGEEKIISFDNNLTADENGTLVLTLKIWKGTSNNGCFYGLTGISLTGNSSVTNPDDDNTEEGELPSTIEYTVDKTTGNLYNGANANQNWNSTWKSNAEPQLQFSCGANNMNWAGNNVQMMTGTAGKATYTLSAPAGYVITEYSFTFTNNNHEDGLSLTMDNGAAYTTSKNAQTIKANNLKVGSVSFVLAGSNGKGVVLTNFTVKVKDDKLENVVISTEGDEHWYYIVSASTKDYCKGKVMYYDSEAKRMRFGDRAFRAEYVWSFWEEDGNLAIKNYRGEYFGTPAGGTGGSTTFGVVNEPNHIYNISSAHGFFIIKDSGTELHAQESGSSIVRWGAEAGGASLWKFDEVDVSKAAASLASTVVQQGKVTTGIGNVDQPIIRSTIRISGLDGDVEFQGVKGAFSGTTIADVTNVKAYFATNDRELFIDAADKMTWREENGVQFGQTVTLAQDGTFTITGSKTMAPGDYYLWITYDIAETAKEGNLVDASITSYMVDGAEVAENNGNPKHSVTIFLSEGAVLMPMDKGSLYYRIPSITVTKDGKRLVVLTDDRKQHNSDLPSHCYLVAQYSEDNGRTWSDPVTVAGTAETGGNYGHGDASIVTNRDNGDIIGIMTSAGTYGHGFFAGTAAEPPRWKTITSHDGGLTWEAPVDHTDDLFGANCDNPDTKTWKSGFSGSGAALQKRDGTLVSSFVNRAEDNSQNFHFFMSKDGGKNWYVSGTSGTASADEPKTLERNNGDLAISVRASGYNYYNVTSDNGQTWHNPSQTRFTTGISGNACDGEYMVWCSTVEGNPWDIAFQTIPNSGSRENVSIALSTDEGATFGDPKTICPSGSAYSATVVLPDGTVGCYYEENGLFGGYTMRFVRFSLDWASNGTYKFTEENPFKPIKSVEPAAVTSTISEHNIGTFYANDPVNIPEGVKAYAAIEEPTIENGEGVLKMTEIEDIIPAHTGVVIRAEKGDYSFTQASTNGTVVNGNMLVGYAGPAESKAVSLSEDYTTYVLATKSKQEDEEEKVGFYRKDAAFKVYNHKAYLNVPAAGEGAPALTIRFEGDGSTGIEKSEIINHKSDMIYDLMGRRVENPTKGVYIVGGRKVVIK
ncbi:MAG: exo-alpha-sialidase, partial [Bacteroidaceae bacterium]|nr:exo-alpha-sialidase [Bacteroidaceae bacterium]